MSWDVVYQGPVDQIPPDLAATGRVRLEFQLHDFIPAPLRPWFADRIADNVRRDLPPEYLIDGVAVEGQTAVIRLAPVYGGGFAPWTGLAPGGRAAPPSGGVPFILIGLIALAVVAVILVVAVTVLVAKTQDALGDAAAPVAIGTVAILGIAGLVLLIGFTGGGRRNPLEERT